MDPKTPLFNALSYRYALAHGYSYAAELFAIIVWSWCGKFAAPHRDSGRERKAEHTLVSLVNKKGGQVS